MNKYKMIVMPFYISEKTNEISQENPAYSGGTALHKFKVLVFYDDIQSRIFYSLNIKIHDLVWN